MMMAALWPALAPDLPADLVKGGLAVSGLFDLEPLVHARLSMSTCSSIWDERGVCRRADAAATDAPLYLASARWSRANSSASPIYWPSAGRAHSPHGAGAGPIT